MKTLFNATLFAASTLSLFASPLLADSHRRAEEIVHSLSGSSPMNQNTAGSVLVSNWGVPLNRQKSVVQIPVAKTAPGPEIKTAPVPVAAVARPADTDGDGIVDSQDKCAGTAAGIKVNGYGCAVSETAKIRLEVQFDQGSSNLKSSYVPEVTSLAQFLKKFPDTKVEVAGYTDNTGSTEVNTTLSSRRAQEIAKQLIEKHGIPSNRIIAKGYGPAQPVADNKTAAGRKLNRRVVAKITGDSAE